MQNKMDKLHIVIPGLTIWTSDGKLYLEAGTGWDKKVFEFESFDHLARTLRQGELVQQLLNVSLNADSK